MEPRGDQALKPGSSLTRRLLLDEKEAFNHATQSSFLKAAGRGQISKEQLSEWLSQDRLYAQAYIGFVGSLLTRVHLPDDDVQSHETSLEWRTVDILIGALKNIERELQFFVDTARKYDLDLNYNVPGNGPSPVTEEYIQLFRSFAGDPSKSLLEGVMVLWATEVCYLEAWRYASRCSYESTGKNMDGGALRNEFIPNWTSAEFAGFVEDIARLTDEWGARVGAFGADIQHCVSVFQRVLDIEKRFWPDM